MWEPMDKSDVDWRTQVKVENMCTYEGRTSVSLHFSHVRYKEKEMILLHTDREHLSMVT